MPNLCELPTFQLMPELLGFKSLRFSMMFKLDGAGKCRVRWTGDEWQNRIQTFREDWNQRLIALLAQNGTPRDYLDAKSVMKGPI